MLTEPGEDPLEGLRQLAISPSGFVFDPRTGATFTVNEPGRMMIEGIRDGLGLGQLVELLGSTFDVAQADPERDVLEFVRQLEEQALLPTGFEIG